MALVEEIIAKIKEEVMERIMSEAEILIQQSLAKAIDNLDLSALTPLLKGPKGDKGDKLIAGVDYQFPRDGKDADENKIILNVLSRISVPKDGAEGKPGRDGSPDKPEEIAKKLESLTGEKRLSVSAISGVRDLIKRHTRFGGGGGGGGDTVRVSDLSSQLDGSASTFTLPLAGRVLLLIGTQFPIIYRPTIDFTTSSTGSNETTITLITGQVAAPQRDQSLLALYVSGN